MTPKLTDEQREALNLDGGNPVPVEDEQTHQLYFLVDRTTLETLRHDADHEAIRQGIADMENGRVLTLEELDARIQTKLRRPRSA
jgi:predicted transcriptional regulator